MPRIANVPPALPHKQSGVPRPVLGQTRQVAVLLSADGWAHNNAHCSCSSGVERILGKDEVGGSIPPTSSMNHQNIS